MYRRLIITISVGTSAYYRIVFIARDVRETNSIRQRGGASPFVSARVNIVQELSMEENERMRERERERATQHSTAGIQVSRFPRFRLTIAAKFGNQDRRCLRGTRERIIQRSLERALPMKKLF